MIESFLADVATNALSDFARAAVIAGPKCDVSDIIVEVAAKPHKPSGLPIGKMAVYCFFLNRQALKIGIAGPKSGARYRSQHYNPNSAQSTTRRVYFEASKKNWDCGTFNEFSRGMDQSTHSSDQSLTPAIVWETDAVTIGILSTYYMEANIRRPRKQRLSVNRLVTERGAASRLPHRAVGRLHRRATPRRAHRAAAFRTMGRHVARRIQKRIGAAHCYRLATRLWQRAMAMTVEVESFVIFDNAAKRTACESLRLSICSRATKSTSLSTWLRIPAGSPGNRLLRVGGLIRVN